MGQQKIDLREFLKRLPLFSDATEDELLALVRHTSELHLPRGSAIVRRGDPCIGFHVVIFGRVKLGFTSAQGDEKIVEIIGAGQSFGEALMFMEKPYIVNATTLEDSLLLHIDKAAVFAALEASPAFARRMLAGMSRRLHGLVADVEAYSLRSAAQRIVGFLLRDEPGENHAVLLPASKKAVASRLNLTPEHFSRVLHELAATGMIAVEGRTIRICDLERLRTYQG